MEFLRNLTPQILLIGFAVIAARNLNTNQFDLSNINKTIPYIFFMGIFFMAFIYNCWRFAEKLNRHNNLNFKYDLRGLKQILKDISFRSIMAVIEYLICYFIMIFLLLLIVFSGVAQGLVIIDKFFK